MGNSNEKKLQKEKLTEDIETMNKISTNFLFYKVVGINFEFFDKSDEIVLNKFIYVKTENEENRRKGGFYITPNDFYNFYNVILECIPIFYEKSLSTIVTNKANNEDDLCCICDDKKSDIMLECCVRKYLIYISINFYLFSLNLTIILIK